MATVLSEYASMCFQEISEDINQHPHPVDDTPSDEEFRAFSKVLGDIGREESRQFSEEHPEITEQLRDANRLASEESTLNFKYRLWSERLLDPLGTSTLNLTPHQRIEFLERLYKECLGFYFRMWNEPLTEAEEGKELLRLGGLLERQATKEIRAAFGDMIASIKKTVEQTTPIARKDFVSNEAFEKAKLVMLKPSAIAYHSLQQLIDSHLLELKRA
jgi:hypothetical protein